jgi:hypothetical protein
LTTLDKSSDCINYESAVSRNLVPHSDNEPPKDINKKVHHNSMHLSKMCDLFSQTQSNTDISKSGNVSYLSNREDTFHSETRSERMHMKTKLSHIDSSKHTMSKGRVCRHISQRDEYQYKSYSKYKPERYILTATDQEHSRLASSEHHSHPERRESCKTPRTICEGSALHAFRDERFISHSKAVSRSEQNIKKVRYDVIASSHSRVCADRHIREAHRWCIKTG